MKTKTPSFAHRRRTLYAGALLGAILVLGLATPRRVVAELGGTFCENASCMPRKFVNNAWTSFRAFVGIFYESPQELAHPQPNDAP